MQISIKQITQNKEEWMPLLLLADPDEGMVKKYLDRGLMLGAFGDGQPAGVIVAVPLQEPGQWEIKNMAVAPRYWRRGIGTLLIEEIENCLPPDADTLWVGTGDTSTGPLAFYESCGFHFDHVLENFFVEHCPEPIIEDGKQCVDMYYLKKEPGKW